MWGYAGAGTVGVAVGYLLPDSWWQTGVFASTGLLAVAGLLAGVRTYRPRHAGPWRFIAAAVACQVLGDVIYAANGRLLNQPDAFPSWADAAYLGGCPLMAIGIALIIRCRAPGRDRTSVIDALIVASSLGLLSWVFLIGPAAADDGGLGGFGQAIALAYPVSDVVLITLVARLLTGNGRRVPALGMLTAATGLWLLVDTIYAVLVQYTSVDQKGPLYGIWLFGLLAFGLTALHPSMVELTEPALDRSRRLSWGRLSVLSGVSLIAPILLIGQTLIGGAHVRGVAIGVASTMLFLLVVFRMAGLVRQVEEQATQLASLARRDGLTGVLNRRCWDDELPVAMDRARRDGRVLSVALIDLDHFKRYNDAHGHQAGDRLLKSATASWQAKLRTVDVLYRYGGEEFGVLLPGANAEEAAIVMDRLRSVTPLGQTFSAGIVCWDGLVTSDALVGRADRALYAAKSSGRDRSVIDSALTST
jgi:diguanylate cyclase (GGDEF)-like protein